MSDLGKITFVKGSLRYKTAPELGIQVTAPLSGKVKELEEELQYKKESDSEEILTKIIKVLKFLEFIYVPNALIF
jgi:hypothetical protein